MCGNTSNTPFTTRRDMNCGLLKRQSGTLYLPRCECATMSCYFLSWLLGENSNYCQGCNRSPVDKAFVFKCLSNASVLLRRWNAAKCCKTTNRENCRNQNSPLYCQSSYPDVKQWNKTEYTVNVTQQELIQISVLQNKEFSVSMKDCKTVTDAHFDLTS